MTDKLELVWPDKDSGYAIIYDEEKRAPLKIPYSEVQPRLFVKEESFGDYSSQNMLIKGENLYALKTLQNLGYSESIKLIYIDPPYNTGNAFTYYDDGLKHSIWLSLMYDRLRLMRDLLRSDGSIWVQLDDHEAHHCRVLMDQIFGQHNFVANILWQKVFSPKSTARHFSAMHDHILVYAKDASSWVPNLMERTALQNKRYGNLDKDPRGPWTSGDLSARNYYSLGTYPITTPSGRVISGPPKGTYWRVSKANFERLDAEKRIWWGKTGNNVPRLKRFLSQVKKGITPQTLWMHEEVGNTQEAKKEIKALFPDEAKVFDTAKPERLLKRVIEIASNEGDIVLDCYLGTGTTAAVAHKINRKWIGIESGNHVDALCLTRLKKVIEGIDQGGISKLVPPHPSRRRENIELSGKEQFELNQQELPISNNEEFQNVNENEQENLDGEELPELSEDELAPIGWTGGGGFTFYTVGKALIEQDSEFGFWLLNYDNGKLIEAVCLQEGFRLCANGIRHGVKGRHYAHVTEQFVSQELVSWLATEITENETLTIYCLKAAQNLKSPERIEIKHIPQALLKEVKR